jgi:hypothetical protein
MRLCLLLLAACGPGSYSEFRDQYVSRLCDNARHCGVIGRADPCPLPSLPSADGLDVPTAVADGTLGFDPQHSQECLDALANAPCDPAIVAVRIYEHCHHIIGPNVANGDGCRVSAECRGGTCDGSFACPGHCVPWPAPHSACVSGGCDPTVQFCGGDPPICQPQQGEGGPCSADGECQWPLVCNADHCAHHRRIPDGKECGFADAICDDQRYCSPVSGLCRALQPRGAACDARSGCVRDTGCSDGPDGGVCSEWADEGRPCLDGLCPLTQTCSDGPDGGVCRANPGLPAGPHESCDGRPCQDGLYCSRGKLCEYLRGLGGSCDENDSGCAPGLLCDEQRCKPTQSDCTPAPPTQSDGGS